MTTTLNASTAGAGGFIATGDNSGSLALQTAGTTAVTIDTSQNVGIGITTPQQTLHVNNSSSPRIKLTNATTGTGSTDGSEISIFDADTSLRIINRESANILFGTADTERMRISSSGNLLVGTTSGTAKLNVTTTTASGAAVTFDGSVGNGILMQTTYASATGGTYISFANSAGAATGTISQTGTTTVAYATSSDYRLKENIAPMKDALAKVSQLKPVTYKWKSDGSDSQGFIAHELAEVCPDAVVGTKDELDKDGNPKYQSIDTSFLVATLTAALQETKALIDTQAETINALTARIVALEGV